MICNKKEDIKLTDFEASMKDIEMNFKEIITSQKPIMKVNTPHPPMSELPIVDKNMILIFKYDDL